MLHPDRLLPVDPGTRGIARSLFQTVESLPIVSPHGHTEPKWWGDNTAFGNPSELFVIPDHYVLRMLVSQGVPLEKLGVGNTAEQDGRKIWRLFAEHYHLFRATPSRLWLDHAMQDVFSIDQRLSPSNADAHYDAIEAALGTPACQPRGLYNRFNIELIATTDSPLDALQHHRSVAESDWNAKVIPTYRPDCVVDPDFEGFADNVRQLGELTACDISQWQGYLQAHRSRRAFFQQHGATATDHGHPTRAHRQLVRASCE